VEAELAEQALRLVPESFGSKLRAQRRAEGLTQTQLADKFGVRQQTIAAWEQDQRPLSSHFGQLAQYLGMNQKSLVSLIDSQPTLPHGQAGVTGDTKESADFMMRQLATSFNEAQKKGQLSPEAAKAYGKLFDYFGDLATQDDPQ
jgi:transcriptional regulator with XRE-family HTH domain